MRVLYFHQHFTTPDGSGGTRSYEFARALLARGHSVTMVCGRNERDGLALPFDSRRRWYRGPVDGIDVISLPLSYSNRHSLARRALLFARFAWRSTRLALREDYDVLFATSTPLTAGIPGIAMKLAGRRKKFVFEVRDLWPELPHALGMKNPVFLGAMSFLERVSYRSADGCVGLSPGIVEGILRKSKPPLGVSMVPNGCDLDLFNPEKRGELKLPGIAQGDFVAGFTGAHGIANGLDAILDAAAELQRRGRADIKIALFGDGNCKPALQARAARERIDNCLFFPLIRKTELTRITASLDCGLQVLADVPAFYYGTSPNKFFDYISAGLPVLINYPGWLAGIVTANACGVVVPPRNPGGFADALIRLADDHEFRMKAGGNARRLAAAQFSRAQLAERWVTFVEAVNAGVASADSLVPPDGPSLSSL